MASDAAIKWTEEQLRYNVGQVRELNFRIFSIFRASMQFILVSKFQLPVSRTVRVSEPLPQQEVRHWNGSDLWS